LDDVNRYAPEAVVKILIGTKSDKVNYFDAVFRRVGTCDKIGTLLELYSKIEIVLTWPSGTTNWAGGLPRRLFLLPTGRGIFSLEKY